ncbi:ATP--guanido phosphotransferase [Intestinibacillus massiliensis]|nr:ATP--guanido phosphotransferase [Intestinibacillus massiliensis]
MSAFQIEGGFSGIVASSRVRLARNVKGYTYGQQSPEKLKEIADNVWEAVGAAPAIAGEFDRHQIRPGLAETQQMVENHIISPALAQRGGWVVVSKDGGASIMIGEEDHLRIQVMGSGLCPRECLAEAQRLAALIEHSVPMDFDEKLGYLTACPTNLGTGLRVSVMLHLPMLTAAGAMQNVIGWAGRQGCAVRGAFGEGSGAEGGFYQLSNQVTLGVSEDMLAAKLIDVAAKLIEEEERARQAVREKDETGLLDKLCRAAGVLKTARRITTAEALSCLSDVLVGLQMQVLGGVTAQAVCAAERAMRPATLTVRAGKDLTPAERDKLRADLLRREIGDKLAILACA